VTQRRTKMRAKETARAVVGQPNGATARLEGPETGRYLLQVDKQTKGFFSTPEAAQSAGSKIKQSFPVLQVAIYDSVNNSRTLVKLP
jgi:hypothetical protein